MVQLQKYEFYDATIYNTFYVFLTYFGYFSITAKISSFCVFFGLFRKEAFVKNVQKTL